MTGDQVEHVVEEADAGDAAPGPAPVEREREAHVGFSRRALDDGRATHERPFSRMRASIDSAWTTKPSARAISAPAGASVPEADPIST